MTRRSEFQELRAHLPYLIAAVFPFLINDFIDLIIESQGAWVLWNYLVTYPLPLAAAAAWLRRFHLSPEALGLKRLPLGLLVSETLIATGLGLFITLGVFRWLGMLLPTGFVFERPEIDEDLLLLGDMTIGLTLVAVTEELVFRGLLLAIFDRCLRSQDSAAFSACLLFGLIHWSQGIPMILSTFFVALIFTWRFREWESLYPLMIAHFFINFLGPFFKWLSFQL